MHRRIRHTYVTLLLALFTSYYAGITLFYHVHTSEGQKIVHSHPYAEGDSSAPGHNHSQKEFQFVQQLSLYLALLATGLAVLLTRKASRPETLLFPDSEPVRHTDAFTFSRRGPPALCASI